MTFLLYESSAVYWMMKWWWDIKLSCTVHQDDADDGCLPYHNHLLYIYTNHHLIFTELSQRIAYPLPFILKMIIFPFELKCKWENGSSFRIIIEYEIADFV